MFAQMKSRPRYVEVKPCVCEDKCPCHHRQGDNWKAIGKACAPVILIAIVYFGGIHVWFKKHPAAPRLIEVNGQMCEIHYKITHRSPWGSARGYDMAVCK
jgi:hypothetical protein